jgi:hypothetical protein
MKMTTTASAHRHRPWKDRVREQIETDQTLTHAAAAFLHELTLSNLPDRLEIICQVLGDWVRENYFDDISCFLRN